LSETLLPGKEVEGEALLLDPMVCGHIVVVAAKGGASPER